MAERVVLERFKERGLQAHSIYGTFFMSDKSIHCKIYSGICWEICNYVSGRSVFTCSGVSPKIQDENL